VAIIITKTGPENNSFPLKKPHPAKLKNDTETEEKGCFSQFFDNPVAKC